MKIYDLPVMGCDSGGEFVRLWSGYSVTTMRHINSFLDFFGISGGGKAWWDAQTISA